MSEKKRSLLKRLLLVVGGVALFLPVGTGCSTTEPVIWSWPHNKRKLQVVADGFHRLHMDIDRIIFDTEEYPIEAEH